MDAIGIGYGNDRDGYTLGRLAAQSALQSSGIEQPDILIAFCSGQVDHARFYEGLRSIVGNAPPIIGGSSIGVITCDMISYRGYPGAVAALQSDSIRFAVSSAGGVDHNEAQAGRQMLDNLRLSTADRLMLLFYDSIRIPANATHPPVLNSSAPLLAGIKDRLAGHAPVFGAGLLGDFGFSATSQFCGYGTESQQVVGCMLSGDFAVYSAIMHGCIPLDGVYRTITKIENDIIYEIDGKPVVSIIDQLFGSSDWQNHLPIIDNLTIGINHGDRFAPPSEHHYVNRLITGVVNGGAGIGMFETDLTVGQEIQFMVRDNRMMLRSTRENTPALMDRILADGKKPFFALYIDCGGRTAEQSVTEVEEAAEVQKVLKEAGVPLLGFYSGVEIAPMLGTSRGLDWTGVLVILAKER